MAKSPEEMLASMIQNLPEKTGKTVYQWLHIVRQSNLSKHGELEESGSFNAMVSHRVRIADKNDLDSELEQWLRSAYEVS